MSLQELQNQENDALTKFNSINGSEENSILLLLLCLVMFTTFKYLDTPPPVYNLFLITGVVLGFMLIMIQILN